MAGDAEGSTDIFGRYHGGNGGTGQIPQRLNVHVIGRQHEFIQQERRQFGVPLLHDIGPVFTFQGLFNFRHGFLEMVFAELNDLLQHMSLHMGERNSTAPVEALLSPPSLSSSSPVKKGGKRTDADSLATANGTVNESPSRLSCSSKGRRTKEKEKEGVSAMMHHQRPNQQVPLPTVNPLDRSSSYEGEGTTSRVPAVASSHTFEPLDQRTKLMLGSSTSMVAMV